jgi:hypothetical protein
MYPLALPGFRGQHQKGSLLFVNKKKQKNFFHLARAGFNATSPV